MPRKKKTKTLSEFHKKYPLEFDGLKAKDEVVYVRLSDGKTSVGVIRYFHLGGSTPCATVIDLELGNYQTAIVKDIIRDADEKIRNRLLGKIKTKKGSRR